MHIRGPSPSPIRWLEKVKKRARAAKLAREISDLQSALDGIYRELGVLVLKHRPAAVDFAAESGQLSEIVGQVGQKQSSLNALRDAKGRASVLKEGIDAELEELRQREHSLAIAIGRKADAARPDMPGAAALYAVVDRARPGLEEALNELKPLEAELGPTSSPKSPRSGPLTDKGRPLGYKGTLVAAAFAVLVIFVALKSIFPFSGKRYLIDREDAAACGTCGGCAGCGTLLFIPVALIVLNILILIWVARDAKARGCEGPLWLLLMLFTGPIGLVIYLFSRPLGNLVPCAHCGNKRLQAARLCPHCGNS